MSELPQDTTISESETFDIVGNRAATFDPRDVLLHLENVRKSYDTPQGVKHVLENVDLRVSEGEFVSLVGSSGAGKSTLFRLILGQEEETSGSLYLAGEPIGFPDPTRGIVDQEYALFPHLTVLENILLGHRLGLSFAAWRHQKKDIVTQAERYLETAQLLDHKDKYSHQLSGGQRQRAAVMQALIKNPKVLLMDEPFGALDPGVRARMQTFLLERWMESRKTIIFVTHDLEEAVLLGNRIVVLSQHYSDGRGEGADRGSRILLDMPVNKMDKGHPDFTKTIELVRSYVSKPAHAWHLKQFYLRHSNSFHTVSQDEFPANR